MTESNFRALCAEILQKLDQYEDGQRVDWDAWQNNARAALAQPEPQGPSDQELDDQFFEHCYTDDFGTELMDPQQFREGARAVLARYGRPASKSE